MIIAMKGRDVRDMRKRLGLTQKELARLIDRSHRQIVILEKAEELPTVYALAMRQLEALVADAA